MDPNSPSLFFDSCGRPRKRELESTEPVVVKKVIKNITNNNNNNNHNTYNTYNYFAPAPAPAAAQGVAVAEKPQERSTETSVSSEQLREWRERWSAIWDNPGKYQQMGSNPAFKALKEECATKGYKPCGSLSSMRRAQTR